MVIPVVSRRVAEKAQVAQQRIYLNAHHVPRPNFSATAVDGTPPFSQPPPRHIRDPPAFNTRIRTPHACCCGASRFLFTIVGRSHSTPPKLPALLLCPLRHHLQLQPLSAGTSPLLGARHVDDLVHEDACQRKGKFIL